MNKESTESKANSQDKRILQDISLQDFLGICQEYKVVQHSIKNILKISDDPKTSVKERIDIYKWLVEINVGKPKERSDIQQFNEPTTAGIFINLLGEEN